VTAEITYAAPHHLVSDLAATDLRRTRAGDAWQARQDDASGCAPASGATAAAPVLLGLPTLHA
jgi:tRNA-2-methylthio-N6-dimethylallyladenosine synthase